MMRLAFCALILAAGCSDPALNANLRLGPHGVSVYPSVSTRVGGVGVSVYP